MKRSLPTVLLVALVISACMAAATATASVAAAKIKDRSPLTAMACTFPDSFLTFSVYEQPFELNATAKPVSYDEAINTNGVWSPTHGYTFASDLNGSVGIHTMARGLIVSDGISANNHPRWSPDDTLLAFESTREPNMAKGQAGWSAVYLYNNSNAQVTRLTPPNETDFSPDWSADGEWVAATTGSALPGASSVVVMRKDGSDRRIVAASGGWPTFHGNDNLFFHQPKDGNLEGPWRIVRVSLSDPNATQSVVIEDAYTPHIQGDLLVYAFSDSDEYRQIALYNFSADETTVLTSGKKQHYNPTIGREGQFVLYHRARPQDQYESSNIRRKRVDPSSPSPITDLALLNGDFPSLSPDGTTIASIHLRFTQVRTFNADGSNQKVIFPNSSWMTSWVNDSTIAFTAGKAFQPSNDGNVQVWTMSPDGSNLKNLTYDPNYNQGYPCYSPDGSKIVYRTSTPIPGIRTQFGAKGEPFPGEYHLNIMDADGSNVRVLTIPPSTQAGSGPATPNEYIGDTHPHWGPNDTIVFASDRGHPQVTSIWSVKSDGTELTELFDRGAFSVHPSMTPDGTHVVFTSTYAGFSTELIGYPFAFVAQAELFSMKLDGSDLTRLTHDYGENANVWVGPQPLPKTLSSEGLPARQHFRDSVAPNKHHHHTSSTMQQFTDDGQADDHRSHATGKQGRPLPHGSLALPGSELTQNRVNRLLSGRTQDEQENKQNRKPRCPFGYGG